MSGRLPDLVRRCFSSPANALVSVLLLAAVAWTLPGLVRWAVTGAVWAGGPADCAGTDAACWAFIRSRFHQILIGPYPQEAAWRVVVAIGVLAAGAVIAARGARHGHPVAVLGTLLLLPVAVGILLHGGVAGLAVVPTARWGGILLTLVIAGWTIATALPGGILLALARRSRLPVVGLAAASFIDIVRGLPLVGILFVGVVLFPLFVPPGVEIDVLARTLVAFTLFNAANMAEVVRGGLQSVPEGQREAAAALGLGPVRVVALVVLPQALRAALPGIVNVSIAILKETTIVLMAGLLDFVGVLQGALLDPAWLVGEQVRISAYVFAAAVFFAICFTLSRYSAGLERISGRIERF